MSQRIEEYSRHDFDVNLMPATLRSISKWKSLLEVLMLLNCFYMANIFALFLPQVFDDRSLSTGLKVLFTLTVVSAPLICITVLLPLVMRRLSFVSHVASIQLNTVEEVIGRSIEVRRLKMRASANFRRMLSHRLSATSESTNPAETSEDQHELPTRTTNMQRALQELFRDFDQNLDGKIDRHEFKQALKTVKIDLSRQQLDAILREIDLDQDGSVELDEFEDMIFGEEQIYTDAERESAEQIAVSSQMKSLMQFDL